MYKCLNPGAIGVKLGWEDCLPLAKPNGFDGIDLSLGPDESPSRVREVLAAHGLRAGGTGLPMNFRAGAADFAEHLRQLPAIAARHAEAGVTRFFTWIPPCSDELPFKENLAFHAERLRQVASVLADASCRFGLEFIGPKTARVGRKYSFIHTMEGMLQLCELAGPNTGLLLDSWHWYTSLGTVEEILALRPEQVVYVHLNDAPAGIAVDQQQDSVRRLPGDTGVEDLPGFLNALRAIGYDGPVVPEPFVAELAAMAPADAIRLTGAATSKVWSLP